MSDVTTNVEELLERGGEADDVLRAVVSALVADTGVAWAGVSFVEEAALVLGPTAGEPDEDSRVRVSISFQGSAVGELSVDGDAPLEDLDRVAALIAPLVLIGWDTSGEAWEP